MNFINNFILSLFLILSLPSSVLAQNESGESAEEKGEPAITLVKYSDYQCPACKYYHTFVEQLKKDLGNDLKVEYKHYPLRIHQFAQLSARAAEAARAQGKFKEMHNMLFDGQQVWSRGNAQNIFMSYARDLDLDMDQFRKDLNSAEMQRIVMEDYREGRDLGVNSTPTFFVNGIQIEEYPQLYSDWKELITSKAGL